MRKIHIYTASSILVASLASNSLMAQQAEYTAIDDRVAAGRQNTALTSGPNDRSIGLNSSPTLELTASEKDQKVSLNWSLISSNGKKLDDSGLFKTAFNQFSLNLESQLGTNATEASLFGLDGFSGGTTVKLQWTHFQKQVYVGSQTIDDTYARAVEICRNASANHGLSTDELLVECSRANGGEGNFVSIYNPAGFKSEISAFFPKEKFPFFGLSVDGNQTSFEYIDQTSFSLEEVDRFGYSATAFVGLIFRDSPTLIQASITAKKSFDAADEVNLCSLIAGSTQAQCLEGAKGLPTKTDKVILSGEFRHAFGVGQSGIPNFAIAPKFSYDIENDNYSIDVPLYFARTSENALRGGLRASYTDKKQVGGDREKDFKVGLFVGVPFSLF